MSMAITNLADDEGLPVRGDHQAVRGLDLVIDADGLAPAGRDHDDLVHPLPGVEVDVGVPSEVSLDTASQTVSPKSGSPAWGAKVRMVKFLENGWQIL